MKFLYIQAMLMFLFSVSNDWFAIKWHEARENRQPLRGAAMALILGGIGWLAFIWVVNESYWLILPDLIGTVVGSYFGIKYHHAPLPFAVALGFAKVPKEDEIE